MQTKDNIEQKLTFGLDIGTRTVVGIVGYSEGQQFTILDWEIVEHEPRAMIDGQIHDIMKVSKVIKEVKERLENRLDVVLKEVSIAAAGRVLKTEIIESYLDFEDEITITKNHIQSLELAGVAKAQKLIKEKEEGDFFCVGFTPIKYYLNDFDMENLEAHKAKHIGIKILATFLPQMVIDSLYTSVAKAGLSVSDLSLEPIAAINAAIPKNYRLLNLALVDVGAGTSDIALTKEGSIIAYGMIPVAGDELTEQIIHQYLVDFPTAEQIKLQLTDNEEIIYKDIIGISHQVSRHSVLEFLEPTLQDLAEKIAAKLMELNGNRSPNAIFCVGGGCQIPGFTDLIANILTLPNERVVLKSSKDLINIEYQCESFSNPSMVTPVGICITSLEDKGSNFTEVHLNDHKVKLLNARQLTVMDAAVKVGFNYKNLMARKGKDLAFAVNGQLQKIRGELGEAAEIMVNNKEASLHSNIYDSDTITIHPAKKGKDASLVISRLIEKMTYSYIINGNEVTMDPKVYVNHREVGYHYNIRHNDVIEILDVKLVRDLLEALHIETYAHVFVNDVEVNEEFILSNGDRIHIDMEPDEVSEEQDIEDYIEEVYMEDSREEICSTEEEAPIIIDEDVIVTVNDEIVILRGKSSYIFVDIFEYYTFDLTVPKGKIQLKLNGREAAYTDQLNNNDILQIYWE